MGVGITQEEPPTHTLGALEVQISRAGVVQLQPLASQTQNREPDPRMDGLSSSQAGLGSNLSSATSTLGKALGLSEAASSSGE